MIYDCIITGGGASGLFLASTVSRPLKGLIIEKSERPGAKVLMSGGGRCNITHEGAMKDFIDAYGKNGKKIRKCLYSHGNTELVSFLRENGIETSADEEGRVFPVSEKASDILDLLLERSGENGFTMNRGEALRKIERKEDMYVLTTTKGTYMTRNAVLACGGCSCPSTGSDGSVFPVVKRDLGLRVTDLRPSLMPLHVRSYPYRDQSGISFKNAEVSLYKGGRKDSAVTGGLLLTHGAFSGPAALNISGRAEKGNIIKIDYVYPLRYEEVLKELKDAAKGSRAGIHTIVSRKFDIPKSFSKKIEDGSIKKVARTLTEDEYVISTSGGAEAFRTAMVTRGGVDISQVDMNTMMVKDMAGLYITGEMLDIDGITGGYNLQFAFSSARCAAEDICERL